MTIMLDRLDYELTKDTVPHPHVWTTEYHFEHFGEKELCLTVVVMHILA